jgi:hypothetical protein
MYISGENGMARSSRDYSADEFLGFSPKLAFALAPYILAKKRLDLEALAAIMLWDSSSRSSNRDTKRTLKPISEASLKLPRVERLSVSIAPHCQDPLVWLIIFAEPKASIILRIARDRHSRQGV